MSLPVSRLRVISGPSCLRSSGLRVGRRSFHDYFVTHLPNSSMHPNGPVPAAARGPVASRPRDGLRAVKMEHTLGQPVAASTSKTIAPTAPAVEEKVAQTPAVSSRDTTVVRIPLLRAKHHLGVATARGDRLSNEDRQQAGTIDLPSFAKRVPMSVSRGGQQYGEATSADGPSGDPQVFYFGIFDGHGGSQCSEFLREKLHGYIESAAVNLGLDSSLPHYHPTPEAVADPVTVSKDLVSEYKKTVGGYFNRFTPKNLALKANSVKTSIESVLTYAFLRADLDFVAAQAQLPDVDDKSLADLPLNNDEVLGIPHLRNSSPTRPLGVTRFLGGSTASVAMIASPTSAPFWHPSASATLAIGHVGDTRILLADTATGQAVPLTSDHHPSTPQEESRLRRYAPASSLVTGDSFGEQRISGLANSRAFGDMRSKRIGVSAEPEVSRVELGPAQYSFMLLVSDGITGSLSDQEMVDVVKEAPTPEDGAQALVNYATEVSSNGDNSTCVVVRLGGWERRCEGGLGPLGTKEMREHRRETALNPRMRRQ